MKQPVLRRDRLAILAGVTGPTILTALLVPARTSFDNTDAALLLVAVVVAVAAAGNRVAGYVAAVSSVVWFDFFLTKPYERFTIGRGSDVATTLLLLAIGISVTELAVWGRREHVANSRRAGYLSGIHAVAEAAVRDDGESAVLRQVTDQLVRLLGLRACRFQFGVAGLGAVARLHHDGTVTVAGKPWATDEKGLPGDGEVELLVASRGYLQGRFMMTADDGSRPTRENLLLAAAFADQVAGALTTHAPPA